MASSGQGPGDDGSDDRGRDERAAPRGLPDLLKFAIANTPTGEAAESASLPNDESNNQESAAERAEWLRTALSGMYKDEVKEMAQYLYTLKEGLEVAANVEGHDEGADMEERKIEALENLLDLVEGIDNARDFLKIGGGEVLQPLFSDPSSEVRWRTLDLTATLSQNHASNQEAFQSMGMVERLLEVLDSEDTDQVRVKALYALSCLSRDNEACQQDFVSHDGFSVLMRAMQSGVEKLQIKAAFMLQAMLLSCPHHKDTLHKMGMVYQLVSLLQQEHTITHEHFMLALVNLATDHSGCVTDCCQPELQFEDLLRDRAEFLKDKEQFQEELEYCQKLRALCFPNTSDTQSGMDR